ncbi:hypothetical protein M0802_008662 [Mischocyttarus mexicanus]|nr:hypothetical protein M0802_008662 [Mischocyttarus mexicanus]
MKDIDELQLLTPRGIHFNKQTNKKNQNISKYLKISQNIHEWIIVGDPCNLSTLYNLRNKFTTKKPSPYRNLCVFKEHPVYLYLFLYKLQQELKDCKALATDIGRSNGERIGK